MFYQRKFYYLLPIIILVLSANFAQAQSDLISVTSEPVILSNLAWSEDGQTLVFQDDCCGDSGTTSEEPNWYAYEALSDTLTVSSQWQLTPQLSDSEKAFARINDEYFNFMSPDERYVLHSADILEIEYQLRLLDRQQNQFVNLPFIRISKHAGTERFNAWWNEDNTAVLVRLTQATGYEPIVGYAYIHNYDSVLEDVEFIPLDYSTINGEEYILARIYDISPDGNLILIGAAARGSSDGRLIFYDPKNPSDSIIILPSELSVLGVYTAQFLDGNNNQIIYFNQFGIYTYDRSTGVASLIHDDIKSTEWDNMLFSAGGKYLALTKNGSVYVVDLTDDLPDTSSEQ